MPSKFSDNAKAHGSDKAKGLKDFKEKLTAALESEESSEAIAPIADAVAVAETAPEEAEAAAVVDLNDYTLQEVAQAAATAGDHETAHLALLLLNTPADERSEVLE